MTGNPDSLRRIDATGKPCPQPVMLAKAALDQGISELEIRVDNEVSASNVTRFLESRGLRVLREGEAPDIRLRGEGPGAAVPSPAVPSSPAPGLPASGDWGLLLLSRTLGSESLELGEVLMKAFLGVVAKHDPAPRVLALMNGGVHMALEGMPEREILEEIAARGTEILVCGTCAKHFDVVERVRVGRISNMFEIVEAVLGASKPVVLG
jgi:selenium metabolism protein YedF